jgi:hypothetical protein
MGVLFQAFYWNCPAEELQEGTGWNSLAGKGPELQQAGFIVGQSAGSTTTASSRVGVFIRPPGVPPG